MKKILIAIISLLALLNLVSCKKINNYDLMENLYYSDSKEEIVNLYKESHKLSWSDIFGSKKAMVYDEATSDLAMPSAANGSGEGSADSETSQTTVVVEGIDEMASIKNDNRYIYSRFKNQMIIIDTNDDSYYKYDSIYVYGFYLTDDLIVIGRDFDNYNQLEIIVYDLSDPANLKEKHHYSLDNANYADSRMIDNKLFLFTRVSIIDDGKYVEPTYVLDDDENSVDVSSINIYKDGYYNNTISMIQIIDFDSESVYSKGFYGLSFNYYVSFNNIYLCYSEYNENNYGTRVIRMSLKDQLQIMGNIYQKGFVNNIFSLDEYNDTFRLVTTEQSTSDSYYSFGDNVISQYDVSGDKFELTSTYRFAKGERVYSVRYSGDIAYVVTYLYIDPLFEFDLSDKFEIKMLRQLKSPGVSDYLDQINDDFILGIGRVTVEHGNYATADTLKVSLFSLDGKEMFEEDTFTFDMFNYAYTMMFSDHTKLVKLNKSLTYYFPISGYGEQTTQQGVTGVKVNLEDRKIEYLGILEAAYYNNSFVVVNSKLYVIDYESIKIAEAAKVIEVIKTIY